MTSFDIAFLSVLIAFGKPIKLTPFQLISLIYFFVRGRVVSRLKVSVAAKLTMHNLQITKDPD